MCVFTEMQLVFLLHFEMALQPILFTLPTWTSTHRAVSLLV